MDAGIRVYSYMDELGIRLLCDVTEDGVEILESFFGVEIRWSPPWGDGIGSITLPTDMFRPLVCFCLFRSGADAIFDVSYKTGALPVNYLQPTFKIWNEDEGDFDQSFIKLRDKIAISYAGHYHLYFGGGNQLPDGSGG